MAFEAKVPTCYLGNLLLHTANRILMRVSDFTATNFRQLEKKLATLPWELYLHPQVKTEIKVSARKSRLYHTRAIADRVNHILDGHISRGHAKDTTG